MTNDFLGSFAQQYETHLTHLKLKGLQTSGDTNIRGQTTVLALFRG